MPNILTKIAIKASISQVTNSCTTKLEKTTALNLNVIRNLQSKYIHCVVSCLY